MKKIAIIASHPIQYYAPWFRFISGKQSFSMKVFYLCDFGVLKKYDNGFKMPIQWDIPLLNNYDFDFVPNLSVFPGTNHCWGLVNPSLIARVKRYKPDIMLLTCYAYTSLIPILFNWAIKKVPLIFRGDSHNIARQRGIKECIRHNMAPKIFKQFSACLYVGKSNYEYYRNIGVSPEKLFYSPHAVDNQRFLEESENALMSAAEWKKELGIPKEHQVIMFAGKFEEKKRPMDLLQAYLWANIINTSLLFVGSGCLEGTLRKEAQKHKHIYFAPFQNQTQMPRTYAIADVFVLPSYGNSETWGLAINEAMCMAKPVIMSDHVGCAQNLVDPNSNGLIFKAGDVDSLASCLREAFNDRNRLKVWGEQSRNIVANYNYAKATEGLENAIRFVLN